MLLLLRDRKPGVLTNLAPLFSLTMWQVLKKQKWNFRRLSISSNNLHALPKWVRVSPRAFSWSVHRVQVKHLFHVLWRGGRGGPFFFCGGSRFLGWFVVVGGGG